MSYNHRKNMLAHLMQFITTIPMLTTKIENGAWHCSFKRRGSRFYHNPSPPPSINVGGSGKASDNMIQINIALEERGSLFLLNRTKCVNSFFHDCRKPGQVPPPHLPNQWILMCFAIHYGSQDCQTYNWLIYIACYSNTYNRRVSMLHHAI